MDDHVAGFGAQNPDAQPLINPTAIQAGTGSTTGAGSEVDRSAYYKSTIEQSEIAELIMLLSAGTPLLQPPQVAPAGYGDIGGTGAVAGSGSKMIQLSMQSEEVKNDIINEMWNQFLVRVHELAERARKEEIQKWAEHMNGRGGPMTSTEYSAYLMTLAASQRDKEISGVDGLSAQFDEAFHRWFIAPLDQSGQAIVNPFAYPNATLDQINYPNSAFIAGTLVVAADSLQSASGYEARTVNPIADALQAVGPYSDLPGDYQAAAALVAALLNGGAVYKATNGAIEEGANQGEPPRDLNFAIQYANNILNIVSNSNRFDNPKNQNQGRQDRLVRLMLSLMALNLLYRAAYGGMNGLELKDLLAGHLEEVHPDIRSLIGKLVAFINENINPVQRDEAVNAMMAYVDNKHSVDSMLETTRMFTAYLNTRDLQQKRFESTQG